ncbi:uncharacterized protein LOC124366205 [Homalodisca vitripennis]|uniref:uncharacterized protein LOC124366205 n=1 Tax=Homalodisca vitripennis TaxID=197043 RepID=UPI001EEC985C|nr:uncharacterized protein LOC124366205 [Homalodisca vitripennis]
MPSKTKQKSLANLYTVTGRISMIIIIETNYLAIDFYFHSDQICCHLWPQDVPQNLPEMLLMMPNLLRTYPIVTGALLSFLTWHIMYLDSAVPGINPPTPLSPVKYREISGADFHINYVFALLVGPLATALLYMGWV